MGNRHSYANAHSKSAVKGPDLKEKLREVPHKPGIYLMKDRLGSIIYVGKARDLRRRLANYFTPSRQTLADIKTRALIDSIWDFEIHLVRNEQESLLLEGKLIKDYRPRYNVAFRDDKRFLMIRIRLTDPFPRFQTTRLRKDDGARYFGPFAHSGALRATIHWLNREFGLRSCRPVHPGEKDYKHCNADIIRNCSAPCVAKVTREEYLKKVEAACEILEGKGRRELVKKIEGEMKTAAADMNFEKAAQLRDVMRNLEKTLAPTRQFTRGRGVPTTVDPVTDLADLGERLGLGASPKIMECFDISNVSDNHIVASMVRFTNGSPDNQAYRRYRIKTVSGQDDFASMAEVVRRRYSRILFENETSNPEDIDTQELPIDALRRLAKEGKSPIHLPDLVIVDGGKGQLSSAVRELRQLGLGELPIIGLAKQREEVFFPGQSDPLLIPHDTGALKLLQRIRDEAHRFANGYNELLLRKRMKESLLDDAPGMTLGRKTKLLKHFGTIKKIQSATIAQLTEVSGISERIAMNLREHLDARKR